MRYLLIITATFILSIASSTGTQAQDYPIQISLLLSPPYPTNFDAYVDNLDQGIVDVIYNGTNAIDVYFEVRLEEVNGRLYVASEGILAEPVTVQPGNTFLTSMQLQQIFSALTESNFVTPGLSGDERQAILLNRQMPEGSYRLCVVAYDANGQPLSDPSPDFCTEFEIIYPERPIIDLPGEGDEIPAEGFINIAWSHFLTDPEALARTEYVLKVIDITEQNIKNIQLSMLDPGVSPDYEESTGTMTTAFLQNDIELPLIPGHQYTCRVTASDPRGEVSYQFNGHSEIVTFTYGESENEEGNFVLSPPVMLSPDDDKYLNPKQGVRLTWEHAIEDTTLAKTFAYRLKVLDMDTLKITSINSDDFTNDVYDYVVDIPIKSMDTTITSSGNIQWIEDHKYAVVIQAISPIDERYTFENDGFTSVATFYYGEESEESDECAGTCITALPYDQNSVALKKNNSYRMGGSFLTITDFLSDGSPTAGYKGQGFVTVKFLNNVKIQVDFDGLKVNKGGQVFAGSAEAIYEESLPRLDGLVAAGLTTTANIDFEAAKNISNAIRSTGKLTSAYAGKETTLPFGFDRDVDGEKVIVGITEMSFTPEKSVLGALFSLENPEWGDYVPSFGANEICFDQNGLSQGVKLHLAKDFSIPLDHNNTNFVLKAVDEKDPNSLGTFIEIDCNGFKQGQLTAMVPVPRTMLVPEDENGKIKGDGNVNITLSGTFEKAGNFMLAAAISPCQIPGLEGFTLEMEKGFYDHSDLSNPPGMVFPPGYTRSEADNTWKGVWFSGITMKVPKAWDPHNTGDRVSFALDNLIKDDSGISIVSSVNNILSIEKGELEGFAISIDKLSLDIIRGQFREVKMEGKLGMPILPEGKYLSYEGIVDRENKESVTLDKTGKVSPSNEALSMVFIVKPDQEGYDLDWLKAHIDFAETSSFILKNDSREKGFKASLAGKISLKSNAIESGNSTRSAGSPAIEIPGITFEGMEISRMITKNNTSGSNYQNATQAGTTGKDNLGGFVFKRPTFSFQGFSLSGIQNNVGRQTDEINEAFNSKAEDEVEEEKQPQMNGFSISLDEVAFTFGEDGGQDQESTALTDGTIVNLKVVPTIMLVGGQNKAKTGSAPQQKKDKGFAISATGSFTISSRIVKPTGSNKMTFTYEKFSMDSLGVAGEIGPIKIGGALGFYNNDQTFGNGMIGQLNVKMPLIDVKLEGRFGNMMTASGEIDYAYWYLFGSLLKTDPLGLVKIGQFFTLHGFNGGAYYHMEDANPKAFSAAERYVPKKSISLGVKAGITFSVTDAKVLWANTTFGIQFKEDYSLDKISLDGDAYMFQPKMEAVAGSDIDGIKIELQATVNFKTIEETQESSISFDASMDIYANIAQGLIQGNMKGGNPYQMVTSTMHIDSEKWSLLMGSPSNPGSVQVGIPDLATITATAYIMAGKQVEFEEAKLDPFIQGLLGKGNENLKGNYISGKTNTRTSDGFAAGIKVDYDLNLEASILYAEFRAMFGFDLSLIEYPGTTCTNKGDQEIGMAGYYAQGQVFAGFRGDIGLNVDLWFYSGKFSLAEIYAAMMIQGGMPNPIWASGQATMGYSVLGGLLEGSTSFSIEIGDKCTQEQVNPFAGVNFIADIDPGANAKNVNVYVNPRVSFENRLGEYSIVSPPDKNGSRKTRYFDVRLTRTELKNTKSGQLVSLSREMADDKLSALLRSKDILSPFTPHELIVQLSVYEKSNGSYVLLKDNDGQEVKESKVVKFTTGAKPDYLSIDNIKLLYPHKNEKHYLKDENYYQECYLQLDKSDGDLWKTIAPAGVEWHSKVIANVYEVNYWGRKKLVQSSPIKLANYGRVVYFDLPSPALKNSRRYLIALERVHYKNSAYITSGDALADLTGKDYTYQRKGKSYQNYTSTAPPNKTVFSYSFRVSEFNSFSDKINAPAYAREGRKPVDYLHGNGVTYVINTSEEFSVEELMHRHLTFNQQAYGGIMTVQELYDQSDDHPYHNLLYMLDMHKKINTHFNIMYGKDIKSKWEKKYRFKSSNIYDGFKYDDQIFDLMKMPNVRGAGFWWNTLDIMSEKDINQFSINTQILINDYNRYSKYFSGPELFNLNRVVFNGFTYGMLKLPERVNYAIKYLHQKPANAKKYKVRLSYRPPYLSREYGYMKSHESSVVIKEF